MKRTSNEFDPFLNECQIYVWEWYIPEQKVRFGIPSLNSLWIDDQEKNIKLATMLERVHPDDIQKVLVRHTSPLFRSDKMFEVDLRLNVAPELTPDGHSDGRYEWYGFRGKTQTRDRLGRPTYVRGVAINLDQRFRAQTKLISQKERQLQQARLRSEYCMGVIQEADLFIRHLAQQADTLLGDGHTSGPDGEQRLLRIAELKEQANRLLELTDKVHSYGTGGQDTASAQQAQPLSLWEHMAELQQVYSLKANGRAKFLFANQYDDLVVHIDVRLLDLLLDSVISSQLRSTDGGVMTLSYAADRRAGSLSIAIKCQPSHQPDAAAGTSLTAPTLGLGVSRLIARRMWGNVEATLGQGGELRYVISLPLDARQRILHDDEAQPQAAAHLADEDMDLLDELALEREQAERQPSLRRMALPHVLIGVAGDDGMMYRNQNLFDVTVQLTTDGLWTVFEQHDPDLVFVDYGLPGMLGVDDLIGRIHRARPETPVVVTHHTTPRALHRQLRQLGAYYLLPNPLTLRKVNTMIRRFLK